ncbi:MAG: hypothetical protein Q4C10_00040 [Clostridia bacterium]|nr:hypothetical protein [Clostridia bacterium]
MKSQYFDRTAEIAARFQAAQPPAEPSVIAPLAEQPLKAVSLSDNMNRFNADSWTGWTAQNISARARQYCTVRDANGKLNLLLRGRENKFWQSSACKNALWTDWYSPNNLTTTQNDSTSGRFFAARFGKDGQVVLFVQGIDGRLWDFWSSPDSIRTQPWSFKPLDMYTDSEFFAIERHYGGLEVFAIGLDGSIWHSWTMDYDNDLWSQWESIGGVGSYGLCLSNNSEGYPELLVCDPAGALWTIRHYTNGWHDWTRLGNVVRGRCASVQNAGGGMDVYALGYDRKLYRITRPTLNGEWAEWECLGGQFNRLVNALKLPGGALKVGLIGIDHRLWRLNGKGGFDDLGGSLDFACMDEDSDGGAIVIGNSFDARIYCRSI